MMRSYFLWFSVVLLASCKKDSASPSPFKSFSVGLVTDVGGRGDQSFNDSALRGLENWAANQKSTSGRYVELSSAERKATLPPELELRVSPLGVKPVVLQSKAQEDYQPNLQLLVDQGVDLTIGTGFMLENAMETVARHNSASKFVLIDSPILDAQGVPQTLPNVRTVVFREEEGSFLVGALAGLVAEKTVGFIGGMDIPLIQKFEMGFRAGVKATNAKATVLVQYTGTFDNVAHGKQATQDLISKGCEVVFHAAGSDGNGVIQAVKEARAAGKSVLAIGVDSDQSHLAPEAVLTSMVKRVDLAVWQAIADLKEGRFSGGDLTMGLRENGVTYAPIRLEVKDKAAKIERVEALRAQIIAGTLRVPKSKAELEAFSAPSP